MNLARTILSNHHESVVCELTAQGRGAICVLAVSGEGVPAKLDPFFQAANGNPVSTQALMRPVYGQWNGEDILICIHDHSYIEVHCHGGDFAKQRIINDLSSAGFANVVPIPTDCSSPWVQAAFMELSRATTRKTAAILTWQTEGAFDNALEAIDLLMKSNQTSQARDRIESLLEMASLGLHLTKPWRVVIAGAANVGKSSLINQMVGYGRSIVFDRPGTTRDLVRAETAIGGWPVELVDTAGLRASEDCVEAQGVALAEQAIANADLIIEVIDVADPVLEFSDQRLENRIAVLNKCDLVEPSEKLAGHRISALTGEGIPELLNLISETLVPIEPKEGAAVPFLESCIDDLNQRLEDLKFG